MPLNWKTVRVFISSTFIDMSAERDYLVKVVFPSLRERLERYRINLIDIDLQFRITRQYESYYFSKFYHMPETENQC